MADWSKLDPLGQVDDRRGRGVALGGGTALVGVVLYLALSAFGINLDPAMITSTLDTLQSTTQQNESGEYAGQDDYQLFAERVLGSTNAYWSQDFQQNGQSFTEPTLVLFRGATQTSCGLGTSDVGPFYCPSDHSIYLDETFFARLEQLGGSSSQSAQAYVIAHEAGHHAQQLLGTMQTVQNDAGYSQTGTDSMSVRLELQADCYAGLWAHSLNNKQFFNADDIRDIIATTGAVGDDRIQSRTTGQVTPETWTHGSSEQRLQAFQTGYTSGKRSACSL